MSSTATLTKNMIDHVETWLGENIMGDMHIVSTYTGWKDFGGAMAPAKIVQTRGGLPFFEVDVTGAKVNRLTWRRWRPAPAGRPWRRPTRGGAGRRTGALTVTSEKLGEGLYG